MPMYLRLGCQSVELLENGRIFKKWSLEGGLLVFGSMLLKGDVGTFVFCPGHEVNELPLPCTPAMMHWAAPKSKQWGQEMGLKPPKL
jgi:hypothetical protein